MAGSGPQGGAPFPGRRRHRQSATELAEHGASLGAAVSQTCRDVRGVPVLMLPFGH